MSFSEVSSFLAEGSQWDHERKRSTGDSFFFFKKKKLGFFFMILFLWFLAIFKALGNVSEEIKRVRKQMEEDEKLATLMRGLRGQNLSDSQFADENIRLRLVEVCSF